MPTAITRKVSRSIGDCKLTFLERKSIDARRARQQQQAYERCLTGLGVHVISLPEEAKMPDAVFVEDTAVVVDEVAVISRMGAAQRRPEVRNPAKVLSGFRPLKFMDTPSTLDGGDVMRIGRSLYVGLSRRTNRDGIAQLAEFLSPFAYRVKAVEIQGCLHLKTGCAYIGQNTILANRTWVDVSSIEGIKVIDVPPTEPWAANALLVNGTILVSSSFPETYELLKSRGHSVQSCDIAEMEKAEGGLTCLSIIFDSAKSCY